MSWASGNTIDMTISSGLRRKRRISRSTMAIVLRISLPPEHEGTVHGRGLLQRVAQRPAGVVHEHIIERRVLGRAARNRRFQRGRCIECDELAVIDNRQAV